MAPSPDPRPQTQRHTLGRRSLRLGGSVLLALALAGSLGASNTAGRYNAMNHQMMCTCGCAQILGECNHVGCPNSPGMLQNLQADIAAGMSDHAILVAFEQQYGPEALASPLLTRFNQAAWVVPPAVLILGVLGAIVLMRRWRERSLAAARSAPSRPPLTRAQSEALARVRRETGGQ